MYLTATLVPSLATTLPSHHEWAIPCLGHLTLILVPGPSRSADTSGMVSVTIFFPPVFLRWGTSRITDVPAVDVQCHSWWPSPYSIMVSGSSPSSHLVLHTMPGCHSPLVPPSECFPSVEHQNALIFVPISGIHHPTWPSWGLACRSFMGAASRTWVQPHFISFIGRWELSVVLLARSVLRRLVTWLIALAASLSASRTMSSAVRIGSFARFLCSFLASSMCWVLLLASSPWFLFSSSPRLFSACSRVSGPSLLGLFCLLSGPWRLFQVVFFASIFSSASGGIEASHSKWRLFLPSQIEADVVECTVAVSLTSAKAALYPISGAIFCTVSHGTMPSMPHVLCHSHG